MKYVDDLIEDRAKVEQWLSKRSAMRQRRKYVKLSLLERGMKLIMNLPDQHIHPGNCTRTDPAHDILVAVIRKIKQLSHKRYFAHYYLCHRRKTASASTLKALLSMCTGSILFRQHTDAVIAFGSGCIELVRVVYPFVFFDHDELRHLCSLYLFVRVSRTNAYSLDQVQQWRADLIQLYREFSENDKRFIHLDSLSENAFAFIISLDIVQWDGSASERDPYRRTHTIDTILSIPEYKTWSSLGLNNKSKYDRLRLPVLIEHIIRKNSVVLRERYYSDTQWAMILFWALFTQAGDDMYYRTFNDTPHDFPYHHQRNMHSLLPPQFLLDNIIHALRAVNLEAIAEIWIEFFIPIKFTLWKPHFESVHNMHSPVRGLRALSSLRDIFLARFHSMRIGYNDNRLCSCYGAILDVCVDRMSRDPDALRQHLKRLCDDNGGELRTQIPADFFYPETIAVEYESARGYSRLFNH